MLKKKNRKLKRIQNKGKGPAKMAKSEETLKEDYSDI